MPRQPAGPNRKAITRMLRATGLLHVPEEAPLVELLKQLASEIDAGAGSRAQQQYLSALKDLRRALNSHPVRERPPTEARRTAGAKVPHPRPPVPQDSSPFEDQVPAPIDELEAFRLKHVEGWA